MGAGMAETQLLEPLQTDPQAPGEAPATADFVAVPVPTLPAEPAETDRAPVSAMPEGETSDAEQAAPVSSAASEADVAVQKQGGRIGRAWRSVQALFARFRLQRRNPAPTIERAPILKRVGGLMYDTADTMLAMLNAPFIWLKVGMRNAIGGTAVATLALSGAAIMVRPLFPVRDAFTFPREQRLLLEKKQAEERAAAEAAAKAGHAAADSHGNPPPKDDGHGKPAAGGHSPPASHGEAGKGANRKEKPPKSGDHGAASGSHGTQDAGKTGKTDPHAAKADAHGGAAAKPAAKPAKAKASGKKTAKPADPHAASSGH